MSQEHKKEIAAVVKPILKKYGVKGSLAVRHHAVLVLNIKSGKLDFINNYNRVAKENYRGHFEFTPAKGNISVNPYHYGNYFDGECLEFMKEVMEALHGPKYFDESDIMTDYFHCSHYIDVNVGKYDKDYELTC